MIELGCGCGLVGLCFAACGAHVLLTDLPEPLVRALLTCACPSMQCTATCKAVRTSQAIAHHLDFHKHLDSWTIMFVELCHGITEHECETKQRRAVAFCGKV